MVVEMVIFARGRGRLGRGTTNRHYLNQSRAQKGTSVHRNDHWYNVNSAYRLLLSLFLLGFLSCLLLLLLYFLSQQRPSTQARARLQGRGFLSRTQRTNLTIPSAFAPLPSLTSQLLPSPFAPLSQLLLSFSPLPSAKKRPASESGLNVPTIQDEIVDHRYTRESSISHAYLLLFLAVFLRFLRRCFLLFL
jgi:hypothetical protein